MMARGSAAVREAGARGAAYFQRLVGAFGWRYVAMVICIYGVNQGVGESVLFTAQRYYYLDVLDVSAARYTQIDGFTNMPWQIKAVYGMISDSVPIGGLRRTPYMIGAGVLGVGSAVLLWLSGAGATAAAGLLVLANLSIASPDVMIDASAAERAKTHPTLTADVQALCWGSLYFFSTFAEMATGALVEPDVLGPVGLFVVFALTSAANLIPASLGWLGEKRKGPRHADRYASLRADGGTEGGSDVVFNPVVVDSSEDPLATARSIPNSDESPALRTSSSSSSSTTADQDKTPSAQRYVFAAAIATCCVSVTIGVVQVFYSGDDALLVEGATTVGLGAVLAVTLYLLLSRVSPALGCMACYIFLEGAFQPSTSVIFDWSHDDGRDGGNCDKRCDDDADDDCGWAVDRGYPCIDSEFFGMVGSLARMCGLLGVVIYNACFQHWPYRRIFTLGQTVYFAANMLDLLWVSRVNVALGISDKVFLLGADVITPIISKLHTMPMYIIAARLCPENVEGTLFALLMGLSNFGSIIGVYNGAALLHVFGGVNEPEFRHLPAFVFARTLFYLVPILLIPCLVPNGAPDDPVPGVRPVDDMPADAHHDRQPPDFPRPGLSSEIELMETTKSRPLPEERKAPLDDDRHDDDDAELAADVVLL